MGKEIKEESNGVFKTAEARQRYQAWLRDPMTLMVFSITRSQLPVAPVQTPFDQQGHRLGTLEGWHGREQAMLGLDSSSGEGSPAPNPDDQYDARKIMEKELGMEQGEQR